MTADAIRTKLEDYRVHAAEINKQAQTGDEGAMLAIAIGSISVLGLFAGEIALQLAELKEGLKKGDFTITRTLP